KQNAALQPTTDSMAVDSQFYYNPGDLNLRYENFNVRTSDWQTLRGWYIASDDTEAITLLLIHDLSESKIAYINFISQMHDRGLNVCVVDMRAHGNSDGTTFSPGI